MEENKYLNLLHSLEKNHSISPEERFVWARKPSLSICFFASSFTKFLAVLYKKNNFFVFLEIPEEAWEMEAHFRHWKKKVIATFYLTILTFFWLCNFVARYRVQFFLGGKKTDTGMFSELRYDINSKKCKFI